MGDGRAVVSSQGCRDLPGLRTCEVEIDAALHMVVSTSFAGEAEVLAETAEVLRSGGMHSVNFGLELWRLLKNNFDMSPRLASLASLKWSEAWQRRKRSTTSSRSCHRLIVIIKSINDKRWPPRTVISSRCGRAASRSTPVCSRQLKYLAWCTGGGAEKEHKYRF